MIDKLEPAPGEFTFSALRLANILRLPQFKNPHGELAHAKPDGSDWSPSQWLQAVVGELGEYANVRKKLERGDITLEQFAVLAAKELADVQTYLSILALRALDMPGLPHPHGVDLGEATRQKFNEVSNRVGADVHIDDHGKVYRDVSGAADDQTVLAVADRLDGIDAQRITALRNAVLSKLAYWDRSNELERVFGYTAETIPDAVSNEMGEQISSLAASSDDVEWIGAEELKSFIKSAGIVL